VLIEALSLLVVLATGVGFGAARVFVDPQAAVETLNKYSLYAAFPALVFVSIYRSDFSPFESPGFLICTVAPSLVFVLILAVVRARVRRASDFIAALALGTIFGNVAYFGIPLTAAILGDDSTGVASFSASVHIVLGISLGQFVLLRWGEIGQREGTRGILSRIGRQPLVLAPILGLAARAVPPAALEICLRPLSWMAASAGPVAVFMIGLYLHARRHQLRSCHLSDVVLVGAKLMVLPLLCAGCVIGCTACGWLDAPAARVILAQSSMPIAITAFSIAEEHRIGQDFLARGIIGTTVLFVAGLPILVRIVRGFGT